MRLSPAYLVSGAAFVRSRSCGSGLGARSLFWFEALVLLMAPHIPLHAIARQMHTDDKRLWTILRHYVTWARDREEFHKVTAIAVDETSSKWGHKYLTLVEDIDARRVIFATTGKVQDTLGRFMIDFHAHHGHSDAVRHMSIDMSPAYIAATTESCHMYNQTYTRSHFMKFVTETLDELRRVDVKYHAYLKGTRYICLSNPDRMTGAERELLEGFLRINRNRARAYHLVLTLRDAWDVPLTEAKEYLHAFCSSYMSSCLESFKKLAMTIRRHWKEMVNYNYSRMTTDFMEGIDSLIQAAIRKACGHITFDNLITMTYLIAGKVIWSLPI